MQPLTQPEQLVIFLEHLAQAWLQPVTFYIFGGSALIWLGRQRQTVDVDFTAEPADNRLRQTIMQVAHEMGLDLEESIPAEFMPLPNGAAQRHVFIGQYGAISAFAG